MREAARHSRAQGVRFANFEVDVCAGELRKDGARIHLQEQPFQVLTVLLEHPSEVVSREELRQRLWHSDTYVDFDNSLNTAINKIREALGDSAEDPHFVETLPRRGYRFIAQVLGRVSKARSKTIDSLAMLPLVNATGLKETEYFSDGVTETIIGSLAQLPGMRVMARSTVFCYKGKEINPRAVGRELNVRAVVTGRVLKRGDQVSLGVEMVDVEDGAQLWSTSYNRRLADIFVIQDQIATEISDKLRVRLTSNQRKRLTKRHTQSTDAYKLYLKGRFHLALRTGDSFQRSFEYFQQAVEQDPDYALAYAGLADAYLLGLMYCVISPAVGLSKAKAAAARAVELDESLAEVHTTLGVIRSLFEWDADSGEREFRRAIELNPNYSTGLVWYGILHLAVLGRYAEAEAVLRQALEIDPFSLIANTHLGWILAFEGQHQGAVEQLRETLEIGPDFAELHFSFALLCGKIGRFEEGIGHVQRGIALSNGDVRMRSWLAFLEAASGRKEKALAELNKLLQLRESRYVSPVWLSLIYASIGDFDRTFELLETGFHERAPHMRFIHLLPPLDVLHSDPRFQDLLRRMQLVP
jgi:TolB-like protein/Flp pilus assembly protein TadD